MEVQEEEKAIRCTLCLKLCLEECQLVNDGMMKMMALVLLTRELNEKRQSVMCNKCVDNLKTCFEFKTLCLSSADIVGSFASAEARTKLNPLYMDTKQGTSKNLPENETLCRICGISMSHDHDLCSPLTDSKYDAMFRTQLIKYFPELGLNAFWYTSQDLSVCVSCNISLESYFDVMKDWSTAATIIEDGDVQTETAAQNSHDRDLVSHFAHKLEHGDVDVGIANLKSECKDEIEFPECSLNSEQSSVMGTATQGELNIKLEEVIFKTDEDSCKKSEEDTRVSPQSPQERNLDRWAKDDITTVRKYQCEKCEYTTRHKQDLKRHSIIHQDPSEVRVYQCEQCEYKAVYKYYLQRHVAANHDPSKITMHQCDKCEYKTKQKCRLTQHMVGHKDDSEVTIYQCEKCEYKARHRYYLRRHMLTHQDLSEIEVYECAKCDYKAKRKCDLNRHIVIHQDPSETAHYQCDKCDYKTKHKRCLQRHKMIHQDESELTMYQCDMCEYKSKFRETIQRHVGVCHDEAKLKMLRCGICKFTAKRKGGLKKHLLIHENNSEMMLFADEANA